MKKIISIVTTFALILGIAISSFATPDTKAKTLNGNVEMSKKVVKPKKHHKHRKHRKHRHHRISMMKTKTTPTGATK